MNDACIAFLVLLLGVVVGLFGVYCSQTEDEKPKRKGS